MTNAGNFEKRTRSLNTHRLAYMIELRLAEFCALKSSELPLRRAATTNLENTGFNPVYLFTASLQLADFTRREYDATSGRAVVKKSGLRLLYMACDAAVANWLMFSRNKRCRRCSSTRERSLLNCRLTIGCITISTLTVGLCHLLGDDPLLSSIAASVARAQ